ncbi:MAG: hypothetical protein QM767_02875 [Anaeromyxobacter sp.]
MPQDEGILQNPGYYYDTIGPVDLPPPLQGKIPMREMFTVEAMKLSIDLYKGPNSPPGRGANWEIALAFAEKGWYGDNPESV